MGHASGASPAAQQAQKAALRRDLAAAWSRFDRARLSPLIVHRALSLPEVAAADTLAAYVGGGREVDTAELLETLRRRGATVLLPVLEADASLTWRDATRDLVLGPGRRGTLQPDDSAPVARLDRADVIVVPGLAFDPAGGRLGRGGGSYDRALVDARPGALVVALAPDDAVVDAVPMAPHDRRVDVVVTPTRTIRCAR